jgi:hypothetical protein
VIGDASAFLAGIALGIAPLTRTCGRLSSGALPGGGPSYISHMFKLVRKYAGMVESAYTDVSKASARESMRVRVPLPALLSQFISLLAKMSVVRETMFSCTRKQRWTGLCICPSKA